MPAIVPLRIVMFSALPLTSTPVPVPSGMQVNGVLAPQTVVPPMRNPLRSSVTSLAEISIASVFSSGTVRLPVRM